MDFAAFRDVDVSAVRWTRVPGPVHAFRLMADETALASLSWDKPRSSLALAKTVDARWTLKRAGFLHVHLTLRREGSDEDLARLVTAWRDHRIELRGDGAFDLKRESMLVPSWKLSDANTGAEILRIEPVRDGHRLEGGICELASGARTSVLLPLLLVFSWYFVVLAWFEDETVSEWADHAEGRF